MIIRHFRSNIVAYLALALAMTSTSYAAVQIAAGSVTTQKLAKNAVTSPKIMKSAVKASDVKDGTLTSVDIKDHSVGASELADGVVPGRAEVYTQVFAQMEPSPTPDGAGVSVFPFTLPRAGTVEVRWFSASFGINCSAGAPDVGLYVDGAPLAGGGKHSYIESNPGYAELLSTVALAAGPHTASIGVDCPSGNYVSSVGQWPGWEVSLLSR